MGRTKKDTVDYFPHYVTGGGDDLMQVLRHKFRNDGYAAYYILCESMGKAEGHYLDLREQVRYDLQAASCGVDEKVLDAILSYLASRDCIDKGLWRHRIVWMPEFVELLAPVYEHRGRSLPNAPKAEMFAEKPIPATVIPIPATETPITGSDMPQSIVKGSIVEGVKGGLGENDAARKPVITTAKYKKMIRDYFEKLIAGDDVYDGLVKAHPLLEMADEIARAKNKLISQPGKRRGGRKGDFFKFLVNWMSIAERDLKSNGVAELPDGVPVLGEFIRQVRKYADNAGGGMYDPKIMCPFTKRVFEEQFGGIDTYNSTTAGYLNHALKTAYDNGLVVERQKQ